MGWFACIFWWYSRTFLGIFSAFWGWNYLLFYFACWLHALQKPGLYPYRVSGQSVSLFWFQDELYIAQEEEKQHAIDQFDLGMRPKLKQSDRKKSLSMPNIHAVKPVESAIRVAFDSPSVPNKKKKTDGQISSLVMNVITASNRLQKLDGQQPGRKKVCWIMFIHETRIWILFLAIDTGPSKDVSPDASGALHADHQTFR